MDNGFGWRRFRWVLTAIVVIGVVWTAGAAGLERWGERPPPPGSFDAIVVLGCRVQPDGQASPALARRTRHAVRLFKDGKAPKIVFTGGVGDHGGSEAAAAAAVAIAEGVPADAIELEERATSTYESAAFVADRIGPRRVLVVTDAYHVLRSERVFARRFAEVAAVGTVGSTEVRAYGAMREVVALAAYAALGRLG